MTDFRSFRASAVVLRHSDWGEADRLLTLNTREQGMVLALVKGHLSQGRAFTAFYACDGTTRQGT